MLEVFLEFRHLYSQNPDDVNAYKRQVFYRCEHIGTNELEVFLMDYLTLHQDAMGYEDIGQFDYNILSLENFMF